MSKVQFHFLTLLLLIVAFSSCTIEKRVYSSGYHVEWKKGPRNIDKNELTTDHHAEQRELRKSLTLEHPEKKNVTVSQATKVIVQHNSKLSKNSFISSPKKNFFQPHKIEKSDQNKPVSTIQYHDQKDMEPEKNPKKKNNKAGIASFISALLSFFVIGIIPALIFGAISIRQFKKNPGKYKNKWMPIIGLVIGYIGAILGILFSFAAFIFGGGPWLALAALFLISIIVSTIIQLT